MATIPIFTAVRIIPRESDFLDRKSGSRGEIFYDRDSNTLRLYDGTNQGGVSLAKNDLSNISNAVFAAKATAAGVGGGGGGNTTVSVGATLPGSPSNGNLWLNTNNGSLYVYINDGDSNQWIQPAFSTPVLENYATKQYVDDRFEFYVAADDSTQRRVNTGNVVQFIGAGSVTTGSDADGNITITGSGTTGNVTFTGTTVDSTDSSGITFTPLVNFQSDVVVENEIRSDRISSVSGMLPINFISDTKFLSATSFESTVTVENSIFVPSIDTVDSSAITVIPAAVFNSDVTFDNEIFANIFNASIVISSNNTLTTVRSENLTMGYNLFERSRTQLDDIELGTLKTLALTGGFVGIRTGNPYSLDDDKRLPMDVTFNGTVTSADSLRMLKIFTATDNLNDSIGRFAIQSAWGSDVCGLAFHGPLVIDNLKYATGRTDYVGDTTKTNAVILGYQVGPRIVVQKTALKSGQTGVDPLDAENTGTRTNVITMVGSTDIEGSMKVTGTLQAGGIVELRKTAEVIQTLTGATGTIDHDTTASALFVHWGMLANFTANFTGLSTLDDRSWSMSLILNQGATPYIANAVEIDGAAQSINWAGGSPPSGTANYVDVMNFTLVRTGSSWIVLGSLTTFN